jgi:hypothetical protein
MGDNSFSGGSILKFSFPFRIESLSCEIRVLDLTGAAKIP